MFRSGARWRTDLATEMRCGYPDVRMGTHREYRYEVRDGPGFVYLNRAEWDIISATAFQRLRDIKQLAMGHMVYPSGNTRFEHSIGCVHQADRILHQLWENSRDVLESDFLITEENFPAIAAAFASSAAPPSRRGTSTVLAQRRRAPSADWGGAEGDP